MNWSKLVPTAAVLLATVCAAFGEITGSSEKSGSLPAAGGSIPAVGAPEPGEIAGLSARATPERFPEADSAQLYEFERISYDGTGLAVAVDDFYEKVLTDAGRKKMRSQRFYYSSNYSKFEIETLEIIRPDGSRLPVDWRKNGGVITEPSQVGSNIYDVNMRMLEVTLPELAVGDIVHVRSRRRDIKSMMPGVFSELVVLQYESPVLKHIVEIDGPSALPLRSIAVKNPIAGAVTERRTTAGNREIHRWTALDLPGIVSEPDMPALYMAAMRVLVSTASGWPEISQWYYRLCRPRLDADTPGLKAKVLELTSALTSDEAKMTALFQFVSQRIRYLGVIAESTSPGYEPHDVGKTFEWKHGVCRDKAALLVRMLELANFKAFPVLFMAGDPKDDEVPNHFFNHAIVAVELKNGEYQLMDPTFETTTEFFPASLANKSFIVARPDGDRLRRSPVAAAAANRTAITTAAEIDFNGNLTGRTSIKFSGINDIAYRSLFSESTPEQRRRFIAARIQDVLSGAELVDFKISPSDLRDMSQPLKLDFSFKQPDPLSDTGNFQLMALPEFSASFGTAVFLRRYFRLPDRKHTLILPFTSSTVDDFRVKLPERVWAASLPEPMTHAAAQLGAADRKLALDGDTLKGYSSFSFDAMEVGTEHYAAVKKLLRDFESAWKRLPLLKVDYASVAESKLGSEFPSADFVVLNSETVYKVDGPDRWRSEHTHETRVLTYAGMKELSEVKIYFNPVWESVELRAEVTSPDGKKTELSPDSVKIMDQAWCAAAPRYPAGKMLVAPLPGVAIGSTIRISVNRKCWDRPFFSAETAFSGFSPVISRVLEVRVPDTIELKTRPAPESTRFSKRSTRHGTAWRWQADSVAALPRESNQAPLFQFADTVAVSTGRAADFAKFLDAALRAKTAVGGPLLAAAAKKLLAVKYSDTDAQIAAIRDFAARNLRSAGPALSALPWSCFSEPDVTLRTGCGNSADRAIVLGALLDAAKIKYEFVAATPRLFTAVSEGRMNYTLQNDFSDVLLYLPEADCYLNDTTEHAVVGAVGCEERLTLNLTSGRLVAEMPRYKQRSGFHVACRVEFSSGGAAKIGVTETYQGGAYEEIRRMFRDFTPEKQLQYFEKKLAMLSQAAELTGKPVIDFSGDRGRVSFTFVVPDFLRKTGKFQEFELPWFDRFAMLLDASETSRRTPFWRAEPSRFSIDYTIVLPLEKELLRVRPPRRKVSRQANFEYIESSHVDGREFLLSCRMQLFPGAVAPADFVELIELRRKLGAPGAKRIIIADVPKTGDRQ